MKDSALNHNWKHSVVDEITGLTEATGTAWPAPRFNAPGDMLLAP